MGDLLHFPEPRNPEVDRLVCILETAGVTVGIIRNANNWKGELAFSILEETSRDTPDVIANMIKLTAMFNKDAALRRSMYEEYFSIGALYYEGSTSHSLSFDEREMPRR